MNKLTRAALSISMALSLSAILSQGVLAKMETDDTKGIDETAWSQNDIYFYQQCPMSEYDGSISVCGTNLPEETIKKLENAGIKDKAEQNMDRYQYAQNETGIPWQVIAALHYREGSMNSDQSITNGEKLYDHVNSDGVRVSSDANEDAKKAADLIISKGKSVYNVDITQDQSIESLGKAFLAYNRGYMYTSKCGNGDIPYTESPYVMNYFDEDHMGMTWLHADSWCNSDKLNSVEGDKNEQIGALAVLAYLCGDEVSVAPDDTGDSVENPGSDDSNDSPNSSGSAAGSTASSGNAKKIAETAFRLAYPKSAKESEYTVDKGKDDRKAYPEFVKATKELGTWKNNKSHGPDCGFFVKAVIATANPDIVNKPDSQIMDSFQSYAKRNPDKWESFDYNGKKIPASDLQSGDVIWWRNSPNNQHWFIVAEDPANGKLYKVEASYCHDDHWHCGEWGHVSTKLEKNSKLKSHNEQWVFRAKGGAPSCGTCEKGNMNLNATAACLAWPLGTDKKQYTLAKGKVLESILSSPGQTDIAGTGIPTPAFQKAWIDTKMYKNSLNDNTQSGHYSWRYGAYCSGFAAVVVRYSGYDKNFSHSQPGADGHVKDHPELWEIIPWDKKKESLQGGDVLYADNQHTWMIVEDEEGEIYTAEASLHGFTFGHICKFDKCPNTNYSNPQIFRAKKANNSNAGVSVKGDMQDSSSSLASATGTTTNAGKGTKDLGASAIELAHPAGTKASVYKYKPTDKFKKQYSALSGPGDGKSYDWFASTAVKYSGLGGNDFPWTLHDMQPYVESSTDWEEVHMQNPKKTGEYKSGDLVFFYSANGWSDREYQGQYLAHVGIYAEDGNGKGHIVQASGDYYGIVEDTSNITTNYFPVIRVYRNNNNKNTTSACELCPADQDGSGNPATVSGGMDLTQAKAFMKKYHDLPSSQWRKYSLTGYDCKDGPVANCVSFSNYFIQKYTSYGKTASGDGGVFAKNFKSAAKLDSGNVPKIYAVFSKSTGSTMCGNHLCGHTGVVLGIDKERNKIIIGEAGCSMSNDWTDAHEYPLDNWTGGNLFYAYTESIVKLEEIAKDAK